MRRARFKLGTLWLIGCIAFFFAGCRGDQRAERIAADEVIINAGGNVKTLDPGKVTDTVSARGMLPFIRGLTMLDGKGNPQPEMAESWTVSGDGKTYEFKLRASKWSNGETVVAEDFVYNWIERMLKPSFKSEYAYMLFYVEGAKEYYEGKTTDPKTVGVEALAPDRLRVRLTAPAPFFPQLITHQSYYPVCRSVDTKNPDWALKAETYVGNGPFNMTHYVSGESLIGERNPGYWDAANVGMKKLTFRFIEDESTERLAFDNHEIDGTHLAPRADLDELKKGKELIIAPQIGTYFLSFNMKLPMFADLRVRKALVLAVDREAIVKNVSRAGERVARGLVPPELYGGEPKIYFQDAQFEEAKKLLAEAGFPGGKGFPKLHYLYNTLEVHRAVGQVIQESWKKHLGIELELENQEFKVLIENRHQANFEVARNAWIADFSDPINFLEIFISQSGNNDSHWHDAKFDDLINRARVESDAQKRLGILREAEDHFMANLPIIPIYHYTHPYLGAENLQGYELSPMNTINAARLRWRD